jgi:hypothetical protein
MLCLHFNLAPTKLHPSGLPSGQGRLLGDVFNGWLKRYLINDWPALYAGLKAEGASATRYAVHLSPHLRSDLQGPLSLQIVLIGEACLLANELMEALLSASSIELGPPRNLYELGGLAWSVPGTRRQQILDEDTADYARDRPSVV